MAKLIKREYCQDMFVYEYELTEEQLELYKVDEDTFWEEYGDDMEWELVREKLINPEEEIDLEE